MGFWRFFGVALAAMACASASAQQTASAPSFSAPALISEAITIIRERALMAESVDWAAVEQEALSREADARDSIDTLDTIVWLLAQLNDNHSFPQIAGARVEAYQARYNTTPWPPVTPREIVSTFADRREPSVSAIGHKRRTFAHIVTPMRLNAPAAELNAYAGALFDGIAAHADACGFVVDLRGNGGGNSWPMLTGLAPLLGHGRIGGYVSPAGEDYMRLSGGELWASERGQDARLFNFEGWRADPDLSAAPVAVLIDDATGSSGEAVAIAFRGRANTRSFGIRTAGASTSTQGFRLSDGTNLVIAVDVMSDRNGAPYPHGVTPDRVVDPTGATAAKPDLALATALDWLRRTPACRRAR